MAVELDEAARVAVAAEQARIRRRVADADLKWVRPELMHLTLVFIGQVDQARAAAIEAAMSPAIGLCPFNLQLGGTGVFPERGASRVLWLGARAGAEQAIALQQIVAARLQPLGVAIDARPFHPHLTLARWRNSGSISKASREHVVDPEAPPVTLLRVSRATLFASTLSAAGPTYTAMTDATLTCP